MKQITILLSAVGSPTMPGQLQCFKKNGERDIRIIGIDMIDDESIKYMVDTYYQVPPVTDGIYVNEVLEICRKEHVDIYFPNISAEVVAVSKRYKDFVKIGVTVSIADKKVIDVFNNKLLVYEKLHEFNIPLPLYKAIHSLKDFEDGCFELGYPEKPVCLKLVSNSGSRGVRIIDSKRNRYQIFAHEKPNSIFTSYDDMKCILKEANKLDEMMLVEYMSGNEYTVDLLSQDGDILYIAGRENVVSMMGIAQKSIVSKIDIAYETCKKIVKMFNYSGNIGFDFMKNEFSVPILMDINPRLTATVSVIAAAGINLPYLRVKQLLGEKLPKCKLNYGTTLVRRYGEYFTDSQGRKIDF